MLYVGLCVFCLPFSLLIVWEHSYFTLFSNGKYESLAIVQEQVMKQCYALYVLLCSYQQPYGMSQQFQILTCNKTHEWKLVGTSHCYYLFKAWASWRLKSPASWQLVLAYVEQIIYYPHYWPFESEIHQWLVDFHHKRPAMQKRSHVIINTIYSSCWWGIERITHADLSPDISKRQRHPLKIFCKTKDFVEKVLSWIRACRRTQHSFC